jgi:hypothetical protein
MQVRLQLGTGKRFQRRRGKNRHLAAATGALLEPAALMAYVMGIWRLASDMGLAGQFAIEGLFSHWQVWMVLGAVIHLASYALTRYSRSGQLEVPKVITILPVRPPDGPRSRKRVRA